MCNGKVNKIISIADEPGIASTTPAVNPFKPEIKGIMQIDICQQWRDNTTLRGAIIAYCNAPILCYPQP